MDLHEMMVRLTAAAFVSNPGITPEQAAQFGIRAAKAIQDSTAGLPSELTIPYQPKPRENDLYHASGIIVSDGSGGGSRYLAPPKPTPQREEVIFDGRYRVTAGILEKQAQTVTANWYRAALTVADVRRFMDLIGHSDKEEA